MEVNISLDVWSAMPDSRRRIDPAEEQGIAAQEERERLAARIRLRTARTCV